MNLDSDLLLDMIAALPDPVFVITESGHYAALLGGQDRGFYHDGSHLVDFSLFDVLPPGKATWFLTQIQLTLRENRLRVVEYGLAGREVAGLDADTGPAGEIWFEGRIQPIPNPVKGERAVVWLASNITRRHELETKLQHLSETDALTGAFNRRKLIDDISQKLREFQRYRTDTALIIFDIDYFKQVNDQFGHLTGDKVLQEITTLCADALRGPDILARFGGEEFAILLPNTDLEHATPIAERLRSTVEQHLFCSPGKTDIRITISAGLTAILPDDTSVEDIIRRADEALYAAKRRGRNCVQIQSSPRAHDR